VKADATTRYARQVVAGQIAAGSLVRSACQRHLDDLQKYKPATAPYRWMPTKAAWAIEFFGHLIHTRGEWAGKPFVLEPWQAFIVGSLWGWRPRHNPDRRRFREAYIEIPRKNGKSTLAAGIALLLAFFDEEAGAQVYCAATKRDQAKIVWEQAKEIASRTPALAKRLGLGARALTRTVAGQKLEPLGADVDVLDGLDVHGAIVDEIHAHRTSGMVDVLKTGAMARRQPLLFYITTAGRERATICGEQHAYSEKVLAGLEAADWFAFIACADEGDDWRKESTWRKANPNFGVSVNVETLKQQAMRAEALPLYQSGFRRLHLNEWLQPDNRAVNAAHWNACARPGLYLEARRGQSCFAGIDLSVKLDVTALVLVFADPDNVVSCFPYFFIPEGNVAARVARDRGAPFDVWIANGQVQATQGQLVDYAAVRRRLGELGQVVKVEGVGLDPWNAASIGTDLTADGFTVIEVPPYMRHLSEPTKNFLALVETGKLHHPGHPCLDWMAGNLSLRLDAQGNMMPDKGRSTGRIDGISALIFALSRLMLNAPEEGSAYADHGLVVV
jgi:phage terminase large subunit-like protein